MSPKSILYFSVQVLSLGYIILTGNFLPENFFLMILQIGLLLFGIWAIVVMRNHLNVFPEIRGNAKLLTEGPYAIVRHPMYSIQIFIVIILLVDTFSFLRLIAFFFLVLSLSAKVIYEEKLLTKRFSEYKNYKIRTKAIIPFLF